LVPIRHVGWSPVHCYPDGRRCIADIGWVSRPSAATARDVLCRRTCRSAARCRGWRRVPAAPAWGSGAAGSLSWPDRIAGWWVHRSGCHPDRAVPAAPRASQRPPLTVSARSRSASSDVHCPSMLRFRSANPCGSHTAIAPSARGPVDQSGWVRAARGRSGSVQPALDVRLHQAGADPTGGAGHRHTGRPGQHRTQFQVGHLR